MAVILNTEGHSVLFEGNEAPVRDGNAVGVAREIGEHRFGAGEGRLGVDDSGLLADRGEMALEGARIGETGQ